MKFKVDENLPQELGSDLALAGHDAETVVKEGMAGVAGRDLLEAARHEGRIFLTLDKGIASIRTFPPATFPGIVLFRPNSLAPCYPSPMPALDAIFLDHSAKKLRQYTTRIRETAGRLAEEQLWMRGNDSSNAVGNLLLHLAGNVRQWIVAGVGGKPDIRVRDREFSARGDIALADLLERLESTVDEAIAVISGLPHARLAEQVKIQTYELTVLEAIYHVVEHFAMHTGQIMFAVKLVTGQDLGFYKHLSAVAPKPDPTP